MQSATQSTLAAQWCVQFTSPPSTSLRCAHGLPASHLLSLSCVACLARSSIAGRELTLCACTAAQEVEGMPGVCPELPCLC